MLNFTVPRNSEREQLLKRCSESLRGTEAYTFLMLHEDIAGQGFWCGRDADGEIKSLVFDNGDEYIKIFGNEFAEMFSFNEKCLMVYEKKTLPQSSACGIRGNKLIDFYMLISESDRLSFDDERRYVLRLRGVNRGMAAVFGIYDEEKLVSAAAIAASNEKYALIADVFTHPDYRSRGYAAMCLDSCINYAVSRGKIPYLRCEEKMCDYYKKAGFNYHGKM